MFIIWNGSQVKNEAPVIKNKVFASLVSLCNCWFWLSIRVFRLNQITQYAEQITNVGATSDTETTTWKSLNPIKKLSYNTRMDMTIAAKIHGVTMANL